MKTVIPYKTHLHDLHFDGTDVCHDRHERVRDLRLVIEDRPRFVRRSPLKVL